MSKFLATAAMVVGGVALIASGVGAAVAVGALSASALTATAATVATIAGFAGAALTAAAALSAKKQSAGGSPDQWKADPNAGIDIVLGEAYSGGHIIYRQAYGSKNKFQSIVTEWSIGPVQSIDTLYVDQIARDKVGDTVTVGARAYMHEARQRGLCPEPAALTLSTGAPFGWTAAHKLSGKAATIATFEYDADGKNTFTSMPTCGWRGKGVLCYDFRKDSSYPGGLGPQRAGDQSTWAWSDNPYVVGATWCLGWRQNGKLVAGVGLPASGLIAEQFVEGANVADINGWRVGGVKSTTDDKWDVLKDILQAGAGEPLRLGAMLGCVVSAPRVSLATIDRNALAQGDISVVAMQARRDRINALVPRYWSEEQNTDPTTGTTTTTWAEVAAEPVIVPEYVAADGRQVRKEASYPLVQCFAGEDPHQAATLARYDIENAREFGPITLPLKIRWLGYKPGDVVTINLPEAGLLDQPVMILTRSLEAGSGVVTVTARSETIAKHAFALGQTAVPPTSPGLPANLWEQPVVPHTAYELLGQANSFPVTSDDDSIFIASFDATVKDGIGRMMFPAGQVDGLAPGVEHVVLYALADYEQPLLGFEGQPLLGVFDQPLTTTVAAGGYVAVPSPALNELASSSFVYIRRFSTTIGGVAPPTTTPPAGDGGNGSSGGGNCVTVDSLVLMSDGSWKRAGDLVAGDVVRTRHEVTLDWGDFAVEAVSIVPGVVLRAAGHPDATAMHRFWRDGWIRMEAIGEPAGWADVVRITVADAHTYVARHPDAVEGVLSHNIKQADPDL